MALTFSTGFLGQIGTMVSGAVKQIQQPQFNAPAYSPTYSPNNVQPSYDLNPNQSFMPPPTFEQPQGQFYDYTTQPQYDLTPGGFQTEWGGNAPVQSIPQFIDYSEPGGFNTGFGNNLAPVFDFSEPAAPGYLDLTDYSFMPPQEPGGFNTEWGSQGLTMPDDGEFIQGPYQSGSPSSLLELPQDAWKAYTGTDILGTGAGLFDDFTQPVQDYNQFIEDQARKDMFENGGMSFFDQFTAGGGERIENMTGFDIGNLPGPNIISDVVDQTLSPASLLTAFGGAAAGQAIRRLPMVGRPLANLVEPVTSGGFGGGLLGEAGLNFGATGGAELANEYLPEDMPFRDAAVLGAGLLGGGAAAGGLTAAGVPTFRPNTIASMVDDTGVPRFTPDVDPDFRAASDAVLEAVRRENNLRRIGIPEQEIAQGRVRQASGILGALDEGRAAGLSGEELALQARSGAATGTLRQTVTAPIELDPPQRIALFDEMSRMVQAGEMKPFEYLRATQAVQKLLNGDGLQPAEIRVLRNVFGEEVAQAVASRPKSAAQMRAAELKEIEQGRKLEQKLIERRQREADAAIQRANREAFQKATVRDSKEMRAAEQARLKAVREGTAPPITSSRQMDTVMASRERALKLSNEADKAEIEAGRKIQATIEERATRDAATAEVRANREAFREQIRRDNRIPNDEQLIKRAEEIIGESWPEKSSLRQEGVQAIRYWLDGNRVMLDAIKPEDETSLIRSITAGLKGETTNSYVTALLQRKYLLEAALKHSGFDEDAAKSVADTLMQAELTARYGPRVRKGLPVKPGEATLPPDIKAVLDAATEAPGSVTAGAQRFSSDWKNTAFWLDAGVLGQQVAKAVMTGGVPMLAGTVNRILMTLHAPHARVNYSEKALPKQLAYGLDGVVQGGRTGIVTNVEDGTILRHVPGLKRLDPKIGEVIGKWTDFQFGTVLGGARNLIYEGNLTMAHLLGQDVANPGIRAKYAANANAITSAGQLSVVRSRAAREQAAILSPSMRRAQVQLIAQMARLLTPQIRGSGPTRTIAAMSILSSTIGVMVIGKFLNDQLGVSEFEMDPSKPGFGNITLANGTVFNIFPQEQVVKAMAQSVRHLSKLDEAGLTEAMESWGKLFMGSASPVLGAAGKLAGFGYQPGAGYKFGDYGEGLSPAQRLLNVAPIPPIIPNLYEEGTTALSAGLEFMGISNYQESAYTARERALKNDPAFGKPFKELDKGQQQQAIEKYGDVEFPEANVATQDQLDLGFANLERANLKAETELRRTLDRNPQGRDFVEAVQEYNAKKSAHWDAAIGPDLEAWLDAHRKDPQSVRDAFYAMYTGVEMGTLPDGEPDFDTFFAERDQVLAKATAEGVPEWYITGRNVPAGETSARANSITDPVVAEAVARYQDGQESIRDSGYWDLRDRAWTELNSQGAAPGYVPGQTYQEYRDIAREELRNAGVPPYEIENLISTKHPILSKFNDVYKQQYLYQWADAHPEETQLLVEWEYLNPDKKVKRYLEMLAGQ